VDFRRVAAAALANAGRVVPILLPTGRREGSEWVALNPTRKDRRLGSLKVSLLKGAWSDFATGQRGGDLISLAALVTGLSQRDACIRLAESLGVDPYRGH
jgi:hypothetical protein